LYKTDCFISNLGRVLAVGHQEFCNGGPKIFQPTTVPSLEYFTDWNDE
jgi:hypothetical protein